MATQIRPHQSLILNQQEYKEEYKDLNGVCHKDRHTSHL